MNPIKSYPDTFAEFFIESQVERNLEKMFDVDSLGKSSEDGAICDYDQHKIMEFEKSIEFRDNAYHVKLPRHEDKIKYVPSNQRVAHSVLNRVVNKLEKQKLLNDYVEVFHLQKREGIIERFEGASEDVSVYSVQNNQSHLLFSKAKVAPMKPKSLLTLLLLAMFFDIKCLLPLLKAYSRIKIRDVVISVDAQVVLSWLLSDNIKTKNQFVRNRLNDIKQMIEELKKLHLYL